MTEFRLLSLLFILLLIILSDGILIYKSAGFYPLFPALPRYTITFSFSFNNILQLYSLSCIPLVIV